jgi:hypothetical protein
MAFVYPVAIYQPYTTRADTNVPHADAACPSGGSGLSGPAMGMGRVHLGNVR